MHVAVPGAWAHSLQLELCIGVDVDEADAKSRRNRDRASLEACFRVKLQILPMLFNFDKDGGT